MAASLAKPAKFMDLYSHLLQRRRKFFIQAKTRSIFHLLPYLRNSRPSWVFALTRLLRCGEIMRTLLLRHLLSNPSSSYALSPTSLPGIGRTKRLSSVLSTSFPSWILAPAIQRAIGRPLRSEIAMILVPFPHFVSPMSGPLFLPPRRWHR